jgi:hypothetical protein
VSNWGWVTVAAGPALAVGARGLLSLAQTYQELRFARAAFDAQRSALAVLQLTKLRELEHLRNAQAEYALKRDLARDLAGVEYAAVAERIRWYDALVKRISVSAEAAWQDPVDRSRASGSRSVFHWWLQMAAYRAGAREPRAECRRCWL